ncbi:MAG: MopE-related protein [Sandaracinaceae bacterium]
MGVDVKRRAWRGMALLCAGAMAFASACDPDPVEPDAAADDAGTERDAAPECMGAEDCSDGFFCNGEERCEGGRCEAGPPPRCDDGIDCTLDVCDEVARACRSEAPDRDGDGFFDRDCRGDDGLPLGRDCDDEDDNRFPGNPERCDADDHDEDCDDTTFGEVDDDGDGEFAARCCNVAEDGTRACGVDCDDTRPGVNNTVPEVCNGLDDDFDGMVAEEVLIAGFIDADFDGQGDSTRPTESCAARPGVAAVGGDCDDTDPAIRDGGPELCDLVDNDCDGTTDESPVEVDWFRDLDNDGFGSAASGTLRSCAPQAGHSLLDLDCDDDNNGVNPGQAEQCNGVDDDCFGGANFAIGVNDFEDDDGDGLVDLACGGPSAVDCDDADPRTGAGAAEVCDGRDNDCDERVDEGATDAVFYRDADGDGWGSETSGAMVSCSPTAGFVVNGGDCDDAAPDISPDGTETCDGLDQDCNGVVDDGSALTSCGLPNTSVALCDRGRCEVDTCAVGFADCDGDPGTGCEAPVDMDTSCGCATQDCTAIPRTASRACVPDPIGDDFVCQITCEAGRDDCDGSLGNGCESDTERSPIHCGGCGNTCFDVPNGRASCDAGACSYTCEPGFGDCDGMPGNGCEADLSSLTDCGACFNSCAGGFEVRASECVADSLGRFRCAVNDCNDGTDDCDGDYGNGCETPLLSNDENCGACGARCFELDSQCMDATCQTVCPMGRDDCDGLAFNGCEIDIVNDPAHCLGCDSPCPIDSVCGAAGCEVACPMDTGNCNSDAMDGCEVNLRDDNNHCGSCGFPCADSFRCDNFACVAECPFGSGDCNDMMGDGCETDTSSNDMHCGGCGVVCPLDTRCEGGGCVPDCPMGRDECNPDILGCETMLGTDSNCGGCGDTCFSGATCVSTVCECSAPLADCNGTDDGCETDTTSDETHCGGCGRPCFGGESCLGGSCLAPRQVVTGTDFTCALMTDSTVYCWGDDSVGQLGQGTTIQSSPTPTQVPGLSDVVMLTAGARHACALLGIGEVRCWGDETNSAANCSTPPCSSPGPVLLPPGAILDVAAAGQRTCVVQRGSGDNEVRCWGDGSGAAAPVDMTGLPSGTEATRIHLGGNFACVLNSSTDAFCWGQGDEGQLGTGSFSDLGLPAETTGIFLGGITSLALGDVHACATSNDGTLYCWGDEFRGKTSHGVDLSAPTAVISGYVSTSLVATSLEGTCIRLDGTQGVSCMGSDQRQELGNGGTVDDEDSLQPPVLSDIIQVSSSASSQHVCGIANDGSLYCWGDNTGGQLGQPAGSPIGIPTLVPFM